MGKFLQFLCVALATLVLFAGCNRGDDAASKVAKPAAPTLAVPTGNDTEAWKAYVQQQVNLELKGEFMRGRPYIYFVPAGEDEETMRQYNAQLDSVAGAVARGIQSGSMIVFASPDSVRLATLVEESFKLAAPNSLKGVRVLFMGKAAERERVTAAVAPSLATFKFIET